MTTKTTAAWHQISCKDNHHTPQGTKFRCRRINPCIIPAVAISRQGKTTFKHRWTRLIPPLSLSKKKEKKTLNLPWEKKFWRNSWFLSLCAKKKEIREKFSPSLSRFSHQFSYFFTKDFEPFRSHGRVFSSFWKSCTRAKEEAGLRTRAPTSCTPPPSATKHGMDDKRVGTGGSIRTYAYIRTYSYIRIYAYIRFRSSYPTYLRMDEPVAHFHLGLNVDGWTPTEFNVSSLPRPPPLPCSGTNGWNLFFFVNISVRWWMDEPQLSNPNLSLM
jgi:hypothetical protein